MEQIKQNGPNKILIRLPNWLGDIVMSFPFLYNLREEYPLSEISVIVKPIYHELIDLLPLNLKVYDYDKKTDGHYPHDIHKYCVNQKLIFNIDVYFTLAPSFSSAFMGFCFRAKEKIGFSGQLRGMFFTHKEVCPVGIHRFQEYLKLLSLYTKKDYTQTKKIISKEYPRYFPTELGKEDKQYIVINVNSEASSRRLPTNKWQELLSSFKDTCFVFIGIPKDEERVLEVIKDLPKENEYLNLCGKTSISTLVNLLFHSKGLITNDSGPAHLASFLGVSVVVFFGAGNEVNTAPTYSKGQTLVIKEALACSPCLKNTCPLKTLDCLTRINISDNILKIKNFLYVPEPPISPSKV